MRGRPLRLCLFGAPDDTGNLGVSALLWSILGGVAQYASDAEVTVFDNGWGVREQEARFGERTLRFRFCGARRSRRWHRPESYTHMRLSRLVGGRGNAGMRAVLAADAVWDVSGGDSFTDLYGKRVLDAMLAPKRLALEAGAPLVLLPQTYGPFRSPATLAAAEDVVARATQAWARDGESYEALRTLAGAGFDPERQRAGVDLAFRLPPRTPRLSEELAAWLDAGPPPVGLNVSGLVYNDPDSARRFGHTADYRALVRGLLERFLDRTAERLLLVPHVLVPSGRVESDGDAARALLALVGARGRDRVRVLEEGLDARETKAVIGRSSWFCGTRMHACIGALSSGVPAAALAYSLKTQGVFATCGQGDSVADLRAQDTEAALEVVWHAWEARRACAAVLRERLEAVRCQADAQLAEIVRVSRRGRPVGPGGGAGAGGAG